MTPVTSETLQAKPAASTTDSPAARITRSSTSNWHDPPTLTVADLKRVGRGLHRRVTPARLQPMYKCSMGAKPSATLSRVRYIDTGSREPNDALGSFLSDVLLGKTPVTTVRVQSGFFGADALGYFEGTLSDLAQADGHTRLLVGSNDGQTPRAAISDLLTIVGQPRTCLRVGVVSFQSGFFHPKVFHFQRNDGSSTAYVGSANLTRAGVTSKHVEAGIVLDTNQGDPQAVLDSIADSIDAWFVEARPGLYPVSADSDLDALVSAGVLGVTPPPRPARTVKAAIVGGQKTQPAHSLKPLVAAPSITAPLSPKGTAPSPPQTSSTTLPPATPSTSPPVPGTRAEHWGKKLSASDAQRKATGNQRGGITLTQGDYVRQIDQTTYFRDVLFGPETWTKMTANTGQPKEIATVPMHVTIDSAYHGVLDFNVSNATNRESGQGNYTAELHLEPISPLFRQTNMTGKHLEVERDVAGTYWLTIS
jgi:hypothetical protein